MPRQPAPHAAPRNTQQQSAAHMLDMPSGSPVAHSGSVSLGSPALRRAGRRALLGGVLATALPAAAWAQALSAQQRQEVLALIRQALHDDPSILREAITSLQQDDSMREQAALKDAISQHAQALFHDASDPVKGNPQGKVVMVEFFDPRCPYCKSMLPVTTQLLAQQPDLKLVLKDIPILGANSVFAARALQAAQAQGKYVPLYNALMGLKQDATPDVVRDTVQKVGLEWASLTKAMDAPAVDSKLQGNLQLAQALNIQGTPAFIIGNQVFPGAVDLATLQNAVQMARG